MYTIHVADVAAHWDLSKAELKENTEDHRVDYQDLDDVIDEAETWIGECLHEWALCWITDQNCKTVWRNQP